MYVEEYAYPHFTPNQVLSDGDLNLLGDYLGEQNRLTRSLLIGTGIVCGLRANLRMEGNDAALTIDRGCGVTSRGHLLVWEGSAPLRFRQPYRARGGEGAADYFSLDGEDPELWELTPDDNNDNEPLTREWLAAGEEGFTLLLVAERLRIDNKNCERTNCDEKGETVEVTPRPVLIRRSDLTRLAEQHLTEDQGRAHTAQHDLRNRRSQDPVLPRVRLRRWQLPAGRRTNTQVVLAAFQEAIGDTLSRGLDAGFAAVNEVVRPLLGEEALAPLPVPSASLSFLNEKDMLGGAHALDLPYYYDHVRHLVAAYEELRAAAEEYHRGCMPVREAFPYHLVLHRLEGGALSVEDRTTWVSAPSTNGQVWEGERLRSLYERLRTMIAAVRLRRIPDRLPEVYRPRVVVGPIYAVADSLRPVLVNHAGFIAADRADLLATNLLASNLVANSVLARGPLLNRRFVGINADLTAGPPPPPVAPADITDAAGGLRLVNNLLGRLRAVDIDRLSINPDFVRQPVAADFFQPGALATLDLPAPRVTASSLTAPLSERALPVYYRPGALPDLWHYGRSRRGQARYLAGYRAGDWNGDTESLDHALAPHHFLRIEDTVGGPVATIRTEVARQIADNNLPLDLVVLSTGAAGDFLEATLTEARFADLEAAYRAQSLDMLADLLELAVSLYDHPVAAEDVDRTQRKKPAKHTLFELFPNYRYRPGTVGALKESGQAGGSTMVIYYLGLLDTIFKIADTVPASLLAYGSSDFPDQLRRLLQELRTQTAGFRQYLLNSAAAGNLREQGIDPDEIIERIERLLTAADRPSLDALFTQYEERREQLLRRQHLNNFRRRHSGLRPACGAPLGGTYVLLCHGGGNNVVRRGNFGIEGTVTDRGEALPGVQVRIINSQRGAATDVDGRFRLTADTLPVEVQVSMTGYATQSRIVYAPGELAIDFSQPAPTQDAPFPGVEEGTVVADFYLPYRMGDGTAPVTIFAPAPAPKAPPPDEPEDPDTPGTPALPFAGKALRYRYPLWHQEPAWKFISYEEYRLEMSTLAVATDTDELRLNDESLRELNEQLSEIWSGSTNQPGFGNRVEKTNELLKTIGDELVEEDPRFADFPPLELEIIQEEKFYFLQVSHFGEPDDDPLRIDLRLRYTETTGNERLERRRNISYTTDKATFAEEGTNEIASVMSAARATADRSQTPDWQERPTREVAGDVWIDPPGVMGTNGMPNGATAFQEIGPTVPSVVSTAGQSVRLEMPMRITNDSGGATMRGIIVDVETGSYKITATPYTNG